MDIIDAHCHVIADDQEKYPRAPLGGKQSAWATSRPVTAPQLAARMDDTGIGGAVLVQATTAYGYDNSYVVDSARRHPRRFAVVGTVNPLLPDAAERLTAVAASGELDGVRLFTQGSTLPVQGEWFAAPECYPFWGAAEKTGIPVCLQMRLGAATPQLEDVLGRFPGAKVLLDHCGYPDIASSPARAGEEVARLARYPALSLKLTHRSLEPLHAAGEAAIGFLRPVTEAFGAGRIAWGSNCPAAEQSLNELVKLAQDVLAVLPEAVQADIFAGAARSLYPKLASLPERNRLMPADRRDDARDAAALSSTRLAHAYDGLRAVLLSGGIAPGTRLTEAELTRMFAVSRTTMRAVLVRLAQEGFVTAEVNRGVRSRSFTVAEAADILEARETLESALAGKAAQRASDEEIDELRRTLAAMQDCQARGDQDGYSAGNRRFHQQVKLAAHQQSLAQALDRLLYPLVMRQYRDVGAQHPRTGSLAEHQAILFAIITRNHDAAVAAMRHHVGSARRALILRDDRGNRSGTNEEVA